MDLESTVLSEVVVVHGNWKESHTVQQNSPGRFTGGREEKEGTEISLWGTPGSSKRKRGRWEELAFLRAELAFLRAELAFFKEV